MTQERLNYWGTATAIAVALISIIIMTFNTITYIDDAEERMFDTAHQKFEVIEHLQEVDEFVTKVEFTKYQLKLKDDLQELKDNSRVILQYLLDNKVVRNGNRQLR